MKERATQQHAKKIRSHDQCELCGNTRNIETGHILSRRFAHTRTLLNNAFAICRTCHRHYTDSPSEWDELINRKLGDKYETLNRIARDYIHTEVDWEDRLSELKDLDMVPLPEARKVEWSNLKSLYKEAF